MPVAEPIDFTEDQLDGLKWDEHGLVAAVVQEAGSGAVLMLAWMDRAAVRETLATGRAVYWSRSRQVRWRKGDTSGDHQWVRAVAADCDGDALLLTVDQEGRGACHTGQHSCFHRPFGSRAVGAEGE